MRTLLLRCMASARAVHAGSALSSRRYATRRHGGGVLGGGGGRLAPAKGWRLHRQAPPPPLRAHAERTQRVVAAAVAEDVAGGEAHFLSERSWEECGVRCAEVGAALRRAGFERPSATQALSGEALRGGGDAVIVAETGSGKTLAYVAPALDAAVERRQQGAGEAHTRPRRALVLVPNAALSAQTCAVVGHLRGDEGRPLARAADLCARGGAHPSPAQLPEFVVGTPGAVTGYLRETEKYEAAALDEALHSMEVVVADEADALLSGGYLRDVTRLFVALREASQRVLWQEAFEPALRRALEEEGQARYEREMAAAVAAEGCEGEIDEEGEGSAAVARGGDAEEDARREFVAEIALRGSEGADDGGDVAEDVVRLRVRDLDALSRRAWRHKLVRGAIRRQHVFAAATMPAMSAKAPGGILTKAFPEMAWLTGRFAHRPLPSSSFEWVAVGDGDSRMSELMKHVGTGVKSGEHVLVFVNTVKAAEGAAAALQSRGVRAAAYHKDVSATQRAALLSRYLARTSRDGGDEAAEGGADSEAAEADDGQDLPVLVCTSSVARGVDFGRVGLVVQAEMAATAEDFLHRAGRTARAGAPGSVVSLHGAGDELIVGALRELLDAGLPVEAAFSRKRLLRKRFRKQQQREQEQAEGAAA